MRERLLVAALLLLGYAGVGALAALMLYGAHKGFWALASLLAFVCFMTTTHIRGGQR